MLIYETLIVIGIIIAATALILFWKQKRLENISVSKNAKYSIDAIGELCPIPLIMAKKKIAKMNKGEILEIITTDIVVKENIERFCMKKFELIRIDGEGKLFKIYIKK
jgi:TusA-related sulfurtransferase